MKKLAIASVSLAILSLAWGAWAAPWWEWKDQSNPNPTHISNPAPWPADAAIMWADANQGKIYWYAPQKEVCKVVSKSFGRTLNPYGSPRLRCFLFHPDLLPALSKAYPAIGAERFNALEKISI